MAIAELQGEAGMRDDLANPDCTPARMK